MLVLVRSTTAVAVAASATLVNGLVSLCLQLDLHWPLAIATFRCVVQLSVLGYILVPIIRYNLMWLVLLYAGFMLIMGSLEAAQSPTHTYKGMFLQALGCISASTAPFLCYMLLLVVRASPWWQPQYFIPMLGIMMGHTISGISVGLAALLNEFSSGKERIEELLALGASRWEATHAARRRCIRMALMPTLNQMNVVGIVAIPGIMTGQILAGSDPSQAAKYQMVITFTVAANTGLSAVSALYLATVYTVDERARLRLDRIHKRSAGGTWSQRLSRSINEVK
ncbi:g11165 [Coccomyxa elongata]